VPSGSFGFIYQPNPATAFNKDWWHYAEEHITLMPQEAMCNLINKFDKLETTVSVSFSEDMLIIFRKN
jgi:hypothetical protein